MTLKSQRTCLDFVARTVRTEIAKSFRRNSNHDRKSSATQINNPSSCSGNDVHDFREEGFGVATISVHSSVKWITVNKSRLIGITVSSSKDHGAVEISNRLLIKSAVTICSKCRMATGMVFMTLDQLKQVTALSPVLQPLLTQAIASQYQQLT